ncbi:putative transmembrane protein [Thalictrum thalictroides]|uniref:Putative transmembrane protein n=1 Tax=Thalictrum thalictroides TaxID=46969 RepID=A0A7J6WR10_THATH|nr:putative transmembrane protein [Thalictrum thalictroides]
MREWKPPWELANVLHDIWEALEELKTEVIHVLFRETKRAADWFAAQKVPALSHLWLACNECDTKFHRPYDGVLQLSLTSIATVSFLCLSKFVQKYGLRRFLYLDKLCDESEKVRQGYTAQLHRSMKLLALFVLPCFVIEATYKIWWYSSGASEIPFWHNVYVSDAMACILELLSWLYRTSIFFLVCVLFRLICYLQILRLQDFAQVFQEESDVGSILKEHLRIRRHLRVISHRYRAFILSALMIITASQFASLLNTTRSHADVSIYRAGELALCSMTMMAGLYILLRSATKITHKAQSITCLAAKWHICATLDSFDPTHDSETPMTQIASTGQLFANNMGNESDGDDVGDEECDINTTRILTPAYSHTICFQKRMALVTYFENNRAGITVFGFMLDRTYLHTIFGIEMSLVLWLLGKTIGIS